MTSLVPLGTEAAWERALYVKTALLWAFRSRIAEIAGMQWLQEALTQSSERYAVECSTHNKALAQAKAFVVNEVNHQIATYGGGQRMRRLLQLASACAPCSVLDDLFELLAGKTSDLYGNLSSATCAMTPTWLLAHPRARPGENAPDIYSIDACTTLVNGEPQVELQIFLTEFDASCLMAVPRLLVHELICHVHAHDDAIDNRSVWAEGVMDWTAAKLWEEWCMALGLPAGPVLGHGGAISAQRHPEFRITGHYAADNLCQWLTGVGLPYTVAKNKVVRLTLEINVADQPLDAKGELVSRLSMLADDTALQQALGAWVQKGAPAASLLT
ncbi:MAG: hypothetical protein WAL64_01455 [Candidatus Dormiibacterota bacterium]